MEITPGILLLFWMIGYRIQWKNSSTAATLFSVWKSMFCKE